MSLHDVIWDELALARDLKVESLQDDAATGAAYLVSLVVKVSPDAQAALKSSGAKWRNPPTKRLRDFVKMGLRICFSDDDADHAAPTQRADAGHLVGAADKIAARYGD